MTVTSQTTVHKTGYTIRILFCTITKTQGIGPPTLKTWLRPWNIVSMMTPLTDPVYTFRGPQSEPLTSNGLGLFWGGGYTPSTPVIGGLGKRSKLLSGVQGRSLAIRRFGDILEPTDSVSWQMKSLYIKRDNVSVRTYVRNDGRNQLSNE